MIDFTAYSSSSSGNLYRISGGDSSLLLECGLPIKKIRRALDHKLHQIDGVLLTHEHMDHAKAAKDIIKNGVDLYCSKGTAEALGIYGDNHVRIIKALTQFRIGDSWTILSFDTQHDAQEPLGYLIRNGSDKLVFATDTFYIKYKFQGLTIIAVECNFSKSSISKEIHPAHKKRLWKSHMSLETLLDFLSANDLSLVREIHLLHLSDDNSDEQLFREQVQGNTGIPVYIH